MSAVAIIPARGQSRGIPRKNLQLLQGKPLIAYSIVAAKAAKCLEGCWVSTEDAEIAEVARQWGCGVVARPAALASDEARTGDVIAHALEQLARTGVAADLVVTLQPTSPLREPGLIDRVVKVLQDDPTTDAAMTVTVVSAKVGRVKGPRFEPLYPPGRPRQAVEPLYAENGNVYATRTATVLRDRTLFGQHVAPVVVDKVTGLDIDTPLDLALADVWLERFAERFQEVRA